MRRRAPRARPRARPAETRARAARARARATGRACRPAETRERSAGALEVRRGAVRSDACFSEGREAREGATRERSTARGYARRESAGSASATREGRALRLGGATRGRACECRTRLRRSSLRDTKRRATRGDRRSRGGGGIEPRKRKARRSRLPFRTSVDRNGGRFDSTTRTRVRKAKSVKVCAYTRKRTSLPTPPLSVITD